MDHRFAAVLRLEGIAKLLRSNGTISASGSSQNVAASWKTLRRGREGHGDCIWLVLNGQLERRAMHQAGLSRAATLPRSRAVLISGTLEHGRMLPPSYHTHA